MVSETVRLRVAASITPGTILETPAAPAQPGGQSPTSFRRRGDEPLDTEVDGVEHELVEGLVGARHDGHLEVRAGAEQGPVVERLAACVADDGAPLAQAERRRGEVVGRVVEHRTA